MRVAVEADGTGYSKGGDGHVAVVIDRDGKAAYADGVFFDVRAVFLIPDLLEFLPQLFGVDNGVRSIAAEDLLRTFQERLLLLRREQCGQKLAGGAYVDRKLLS